MEAIAVHSSPPTTNSSLPSSPVISRQGKSGRETKNGNNNNTKKRKKRQRSHTASPTVEGNGRARIRLPSDTEGDSDSKPTAQTASSPGNGKFKALNAVQRRLKGFASDSNSDAQVSLETPKAKRTAPSTSSRVLSGSPDPIDALEEGSSPPPGSIINPNISSRSSGDDTPRPKSRRRERSPKKALPNVHARPSNGLSKVKTDVHRSLSDRPKATSLSDLEPSRPASELFGVSPPTRRKSTVSTSVMKKPRVDGELHQRRLNGTSQPGSMNSATQLQPRVKGAVAPSARKKDDSKTPTPQRSQGDKKRRSLKPTAPVDRFSDDESERTVGVGKKSSRNGKQSKQDEEGAKYLEEQKKGEDKRMLEKHKAKIKAKLQSQERLAAAQFEAEDRERATSWRGVEYNNQQGESFFALTATVDIAETEEKIARAQAAIDTKPVSLSQETDADEVEEERYCARFCNYDDLCDICFGPMPKNPSNDLLKLRRKLKRGAHKTQGITFCTMHRAETKTLPLGWRAGYPKELDFANIDSRLEEGFVRDRIARVANCPKNSKFFRRARKDIDLIGLTRWQSLTAQSSDEVLSTATPGYYGDLGRAIIIHHFQHLVKWKLLTLRSDDIQPLSSTDFIIHVLVPEAAILLIMQDQGWDGEDTDREAAKAARAKAMDTHRQSGEYGRAAFREESAQGREVLGQLEATLEKKRRRLERRAREEAEVHHSQVIEVLSSDPVDPSSDYGDDPAWLNDAFEAYEAFDPKDVTPRPRLPSTKLSRTSVHSSQYR